MIKLLAAIPYFKRRMLQWATDVQFAGLPNQDKLDYAFTDSKGIKWFRWVNETFMPIARYDQIQIHLIEIESRVSRKSLIGWIDAVSKILERNNIKKIREDVSHLLGGLKERLELLHEPELMMRFISGTHIREDQLDNPEVWNQRLEEDKFKQLMMDQNDHLYDFLKKNGLNHLFPSSNITPKEWNKYLGTQIKKVVGFDQMTGRIGTTLNQELSNGEIKGGRRENGLPVQRESATTKS